MFVPKYYDTLNIDTYNRFQTVDTFNKDIFLLERSRMSSGSFFRDSDSNTFKMWLDEQYSIDKVDQHFQYLNYSAFNKFFRDAHVDTPRCLLASGSVRRDINKITLLRLSNYLMRQGKRAFTLNLFMSKLNLIWSTHCKSVISEADVWKWTSIYLYLSQGAFDNNKLAAFPTNFTLFDIYDNKFTSVGRAYTTELDYRNIIFPNINLYNPLFFPYVYKVDKAIYKNSRGKSGKFTFLWKYIQPYKRRQLAMSWIIKEVRMQPGRTIGDRLETVLNTLYSTPHKIFIYKLRKFSSNYVYYNARKTLGETYRTVTK